jgi:hypothetical protein
MAPGALVVLTMILLGSISPTFYDQLLCATDPESAKKTVKLSFFFAILGSERAKAARKTLMKLTPGGVLRHLQKCMEKFFLDFLLKSTVDILFSFSLSHSISIKKR